MRRTARLTDALGGRKKAVVSVGAAAALVGAGTASAATLASTGHAPAAVTSLSRTSAAHTAVVDPVVVPSVGLTAKHAAGTMHAAGASVAPKHNVPSRAGSQVAAVKTVAVRATVKPASTGKLASTGKPASASKPATGGSWSKVQAIVASQTSSSEPKAADHLQPVGTSGAQAWMPISSSQLANATTIVKQALDKEMGLRSAVIAVATSMQESNLTNISYGTADSVGLFQQRPSCGWGTVRQIMDPRYAADSFLSALKEHQASDSGWARQPLWANAQAVQASGFPYAYAKWETQAAHLVKQIVTELR
jgi:hypothetical protein